MASFWDNLAPKFPEAPSDQFIAYPGSQLVLIETSFLTYEENACDTYHFILPTRFAPQVVTNSKLQRLETNSFFACNPGQFHRVVGTGITDFKAFILYLDNTFLQSVSRTLYGSERLELYSSSFQRSIRVKSLMNDYMEEARLQQPGSGLLLQSLGVQLAVYLLREGTHNLSSRSLRLQDYMDKRCVKKAVEYLQAHYDANITLDGLAGEMNYSPYHFLRIFKAATGSTPFEYLLNIKIEKAKELLRYTDFSVEQISGLCGFNSGSYFTQAFRRKVGATPTAYKKAL
jgi:AraC-like DNA-binding protein